MTALGERFDVLVVGAGPAGSAIAAHAAASGATVLLVESARHPRRKACAEYASPRIAEELAALGVAAGSWRHAAVPVESMRVFARRSDFELRYARRATMRAAWGVDRAAFDQLLARHAESRGATLRESTRFVDVLRDGGRVVGARLADHDGERTVRAGLVIGADGARSLVSRRLLIERRVRWPARMGLIAHYREPEASRDAASAEMHVGDGLYIGLAPTPNGLLNVGMALPLGGDRRPAAERFEAAIASLPRVAQRLAGAERVTRISGVAPIGHRVSDVAGSGWLLVGDAAGFVDPFTGEGIYRALRSARAAAAAVGDANRGASSAEVAARYRAERRAAFAAKDALGWLIQAFLATPPLFEYVARRLAARPDVRLRLGSALGDVRPAVDTLSPRFVSSLLRP